MEWLNEQLDPSNWAYLTVYVVMISFFCFFYTSVTFQPVEVAGWRLRVLNTSAVVLQPPPRPLPAPDARTTSSGPTTIRR